MKYTYKTVKIDSKQAIKLQSKGYKIINTYPFNGTIQFEIPEKQKFEFAISWDKKTIEYDKSINRKDGLYPDSVLWGMAVNGICNPTVKTLLEEIATIVNQ
jgi:hypothetical protein